MCSRSGLTTVTPASLATILGRSAQAYMIPVIAMATTAVTSAAWVWSRSASTTSSATANAAHAHHATRDPVVR